MSKNVKKLIEKTGKFNHITVILQYYVKLQQTGYKH